MAKSYSLRGRRRSPLWNISTATRTVLFNPPIYIEGEQNNSSVEVALQWNDGYNESVFSFANNILTPEGGTHLAGFRTALTRVINDYARKSGHAQGQRRRT